ncbi:MAG: hypothetical protein ACOVQX_00605 [Legionella sp.]
MFFAPQENRTHNPIASQIESIKNEQIIFDPASQIHNDLLIQCNDIVTSKLYELQSIDRKIVLGFALGSISFALSWFMPFASIAACSLMYASYQLGLRENSYQEFKHAINNLAWCCQWSIVGEQTFTQLISLSSINQMLKTLSVHTTREQLLSCVAPPYQQAVTEYQQKVRAEQTLQLFGEQLNAEQTTAYTKVYGYDQCGIFDLIKTAFLVIKYGLHTAKQSFFNQQEESPIAVEQQRFAT